MGLYSDLQESLKFAFDGELADAVRSFTLSYETGKQYDPITGLTVPGTPVSEVTRGVFDNLKSQGTWDYDTVQFDYKEFTVIVLDSELVMSVDVDSVDYYVLEGTNKYRVLEFKKDPANATYLFRIIPDNTT